MLQPLLLPGEGRGEGVKITKLFFFIPSSYPSPGGEGTLQQMYLRSPTSAYDPYAAYPSPKGEGFTDPLSRTLKSDPPWFFSSQWIDEDDGRCARPARTFKGFK